MVDEQALTERLRTCDPSAVVCRDELLAWLRVDMAELRDLVKHHGCPKAAYGLGRTGVMGSRSRWRVGAIRTWLRSRNKEE